MKTFQCTSRILNLFSKARIHATTSICGALVLLTTTNSNLFADDTPKTLCINISSLVGDIRPSDLSDLSQRQQLNVRHYLDELARSNLEIPARLHVIKDRIFGDRSFGDPKLNLTLIFPGVCESQCIGTAILPGPGRFRMQTFSYRKNLVIRPVRYPFVTHDLETALGSLVLLDKEGRSLVAFYDIFNKTGTNQGSDGELNYARSAYSRVTPSAIGEDFKNYLACLLNVFDVNAPMPGSGAR